ncbi:protein crumbs [Cylas formicarius]|uniref:protein crumbs n=1 Tax=Cylas formicarius TaxID=197179 RepID=UPI002958D536|nr:protein crumbs [Cylas formicarius]
MEVLPWKRVSFLCLAYLYLNEVHSFGGLPYAGPSNQSEAYFNGSSYLRLQTTISLKRPTGLSFRTCQGGKLFSQQQNDDLLELSVNPKGVVFKAKSDGILYEEIMFGNYVNNKWHTVFLQYRLGNLTLEVDGNLQLVANSSYHYDLLAGSGLYNEGAAVLLIGKNFNGCLLEGPSVVFEPNLITSSHNVVFGRCPIPLDSCKPVETGYDYCITEPCMRHGTCLSGQNTYTCACLPRYTGKNCEIDLGNPCDKRPPLCRNGATCSSDAAGDYLCTCAPGFTGRRCESEIKIHPKCKINPCLNGGSCDIDPDTDAIYCLCRPGFSGPHCDVNVDECTPNPCFNGGACVDALNNFTCDCNHTGYRGRMCDININECLANPCLNGGICFDTYGSYLCQCPAGFGGKNCQFSVDECASQPCFNNGICVSHANSYECKCLPGYLGDNCEIEQRQQKHCVPGFCPPYSDCVADTTLGPRCVCKPEYPGDFPNCNTLCANNPCKNGGSCGTVNGNLNCTCPPGFAGRLCQINVNECVSNPCLNGGVCVDKVDSFACNCTEQWMGPICEKPYDVCGLGPCQNGGDCVSAPNKRDFVCECPPGFEGARCEINVDDCEDIACPHGQVCFDLVNGHECKCPSGYVGDDCSTDVDPCARDPCYNGTCVVDKSSRQTVCKCHPGFTGPLCDMDVNECLIPGSKICNNGICVNTEGSFQCYCMPGFTGERCNLDFNECLSMPCRNNATCVNLINNYECRCPAGYEGKDCSLNIDDCAVEPCMEGATCVDGVDEYTCVCPAGLAGKLCDINIDDCESSPCLNGARCIDGLNEYACDCSDTGYEGTHCENNIDDCKGNPCMNGAECVDRVKDYACNCYDGYTGRNCEIDIPECESNPCKYGGVCLEKSNMTLYNPSIVAALNVTLPDSFDRPFNYSAADGYECLCIPGVTGHNCEININECESNPCHFGACLDQIGGYECECEDGYEGKHCEMDIDECDKFKPCVHGTCDDRVANYFCYCEQGFGGKNCSVELIGCFDGPCQNGGECQPYLINENEHRFNCTCRNGYNGHICEKITTMSFSGNSLVIVNTTREEGYDVQFRFKTNIGDGLLALGKGLTYYILELSRGRLNLQTSLLNKWEGVFIGSNLNDSNWQSVFVAINSTHLVLGANEGRTIYPITFNENYNISPTSFPVTYFGGIPFNLRKLTHGQPFLVGCAEDILINNEWVLPQSKNTTLLTFQNIEVGCTREPQCSPNPCHSGGHCTDLWRTFSCTCERPYLGNTCQHNYTAATFGHEGITDSLVTVDVFDYARRAVETVVDISMFIRTRQSRGQIFYLGSFLGASNFQNETYIAAQLEGGELLVRIQINGSLEAYTVSGVKLDNGYNHLIKVIRNFTLLQVKLNGSDYFRKPVAAPGILDAQVLFLGGQPQLRSVRQAEHGSKTKADLLSPTASTVLASTLSNVNFKGIIQDVQISNGSNVMVVEFFPLATRDLLIPPAFGSVSFDKSLVLEGVVSDDLCKVNPCEHNGRCEVTWNDYRCVCTRGFKGKNCNELEFCELEGCPTGAVCKNLEDGYECIANATFDGTQEPLQYRLTLLPNSTDDFEVNGMELTYRTRSWGTLLFAKLDADHFAIFIYHNEVVIVWSLEGVTGTKRLKKEKFDGQWLDLVLVFRDRTLAAGFRENFLDKSYNLEPVDIDTETLSLLLKHGDVYVAGSDGKTFDYQALIENTDLNATGYFTVLDTTTVDSLVVDNSLESTELYVDELFLYKIDRNKKSDRFRGCLGEIRIDGLLLPYFTTAELYHKQTYAEELFELQPSTKPVLGCVLCYDADCSDRGVCVNTTETYRCACDDGYKADDCSIDINECENHQCQNNATCVDLVARYQCECLAGYEGRFCENDIDECLSDPCEHGGTCLDLIGTFKCECPDGFVGKQCEAPLLITCENKPCREGATCKTGPNEQTGYNFTCFCTEGMEGPLCDTPFCQRKRCQQGYCNATARVPFCDCQPGFEGRFCEVNVNECVAANGKSPCQNGGVCVDGIARYDCNCSGTGFTGLLCEMDIDECKLSPAACGEMGVCENLPGNYRCTCGVPGKCGHHCLLDDPCVHDRPCANGRCESQCKSIADYFCECEGNFTGKNCTELKMSASKAESGLNILYVIVPIVLILLAAFVIGMAVLVNVARSKRATRGTYSPSAQEFCNPRVELDYVLKPPPLERLI